MGDLHVIGQNMSVFHESLSKKLNEVLEQSSSLAMTTFTKHHRSFSHLPAIPVEVIERILKLVFLRPSKLTPSSDPYHLVGTSHLLLVSKGFRQLCAPFFYHSITIHQPYHYVEFFDPENGIFVAGEEGRKRWSYVQELSILAGVELPAVTPDKEGTGPNVNALSSFVASFTIPSDRFPSSKPFETVCLLESNVSIRPLDTTLDDPTLEVIQDAQYRRSNRDKQLRSLEIQYELADEAQQEAGRGRLEWDDWLKRECSSELNELIDNDIQWRVKTYLRDGRARFLPELFSATQPRAVLMSHLSVGRLPPHIFFDAKPVPAAVELHWHATWDRTRPHGDVFARASFDFGNWSPIPQLTLVGFPEETYTSFSGEMEKALNREHPDFGLSWIWKFEDGGFVTIGVPEIARRKPGDKYRWVLSSNETGLV